MNKQRFVGKVLENKIIAKDIYSMTIQSKDVVKATIPGQFINVYLKDSSALLPRPISICSVEKDKVTLVYRVVGKGTKELASYQLRDEILTSSSLGNGFKINELYHEQEDRYKSKDQGKDTDKIIALVGGGMGIAPLIGLARSIKNVKLIAIIGFQQEPFLVEKLEEVCDEVYITTDNGSVGFRGNVIEFIKENNIKADYIMSCGPKPMLKALSSYCLMENIPVQVLMEERMGCGYGACLGCVCKIRQISDQGIETLNKKVCKDGPVFFGSEVVWDEQ